MKVRVAGGSVRNKHKLRCVTLIKLLLFKLAGLSPYSSAGLPIDKIKGKKYRFSRLNRLQPQKYCQSDVADHKLVEME